MVEKGLLFIEVVAITNYYFSRFRNTILDILVSKPQK